MNSDIKPDFEKLAERICSQWNYHTVDDVDSMKDGMEKIWTDHVEPLLSTVKRLQEENTEYKGKIDFYRNETSKLRKFLEDNKIGNPNQKLFDALYDHLVRLQEENAEFKTKSMTLYTPEIAKPVETFKASFDRTCLDCINKDMPIDSEAKKEIWIDFAGNYVDVLMSMYGWKSCYESMKAEFEKLKGVANNNIEEFNANARQLIALQEENEQLKNVLSQARPYVTGAYECMFPDQSENDYVIESIDRVLKSSELNKES